MLLSSDCKPVSPELSQKCLRLGFQLHSHSLIINSHCWGVHRIHVWKVTAKQEKTPEHFNRYLHFYCSLSSQWEVPVSSLTSAVRVQPSAELQQTRSHCHQWRYQTPTNRVRETAGPFLNFSEWDSFSQCKIFPLKLLSQWDDGLMELSS